MRNAVPSRQTRRFFVKISYPRRLTVHSPGTRKFQNTSSSFRWPRKQQRYPVLTPCDFHLLASLRKNCIKQIPTLRKNYETISAARFQQLPGKGSSTLMASSAGAIYWISSVAFWTSAVALRDLLHFRSVVVTTVLGVAHFTECCSSREEAQHARTCGRHFSVKKELFHPLQEIRYLEAYEIRDNAQPGKTVKQLTTWT